jgi:hypothetical protein
VLGCRPPQAPEGAGLGPGPTGQGFVAGARAAPGSLGEKIVSEPVTALAARSDKAALSDLALAGSLLRVTLRVTLT